MCNGFYRTPFCAKCLKGLVVEFNTPPHAASADRDPVSAHAGVNEALLTPFCKFALALAFPRHISQSDRGLGYRRQFDLNACSLQQPGALPCRRLPSTKMNSPSVGG